VPVPLGARKPDAAASLIHALHTANAESPMILVCTNNIWNICDHTIVA